MNQVRVKYGHREIRSVSYLTRGVQFIGTRNKLQFRHTHSSPLSVTFTVTMSGRGASKTNTRAMKANSAAETVTPTPPINYSNFISDKLVVLDPFQTKYNTWARFRYDNGPFTVRTPTFARVIIKKKDDKEGLTVMFPMDGYDTPGSDVNKFTDGVLAEIEAQVIKQLTDKGFRFPSDKRGRDGEALVGEGDMTYEQVRDSIRSMLRPILTPGRDGRSPLFITDVAVDNPGVKKIDKLIPTFTKFVDSDMKLMSMKEVNDILEDKDMIYPVRALINFSHVYTSMSQGKEKRLGIKHAVMGLQFMKGESRQSVASELNVSGEDVVNMFM